MAKIGVKVSRRHFTIEQKQSIIAELDGGADLKALLARESITHSHIAAFRKSVIAKDPPGSVKKTVTVTPMAMPKESLGEIVLKRLDSFEERLDKLLAASEPSKQLLEIQSQLDKITEVVTKPRV